MDATAHSPDAVWRWLSPAIGTARAEGRDGNCGYWLHTPHASSHRPPDAAPGGEAAVQQDSGVSHRAGKENLGRISDLSSRK